MDAKTNRRSHVESRTTKFSVKDATAVRSSPLFVGWSTVIACS